MPDEALARLLEGNRRYVEERPRHPHQRATHRQHLAASQHPFAVILGCADSRVPPEIIFDEGLGDLFVVRSAGHILDAAVIGSLEYAVTVLGTPVMVVLGHERCGAVGAAVDVALDPTTDQPAGHIGSVVSAILPAVRAARAAEGTAAVAGEPGRAVPGRSGRALEEGSGNSTADHTLDHAVRTNVELIVDQLRATEPYLAPAVREGRLRIVGAYYHLETGTVDVIVP